MTNKKSEIVWLLAIFLGALLFRLYAFSYLPLRSITDDAYEYNYIAQNIPKVLNNEVLENRDTFLYFGAKRGWLYPSFIAVIYKTFGYHPHYVILLQVLIGSFTCVLVYAIGRELFSRKVGILASFLAAFYPAFLFYSTILYQETTAIFLLTLYVFLLSRAISRKKLLLYFISGILITVISFYRSGFLLFFVFTTPVLFSMLWLYYKKDFLRSFLYFCVGVFCMLLLYGTLSYRLSGSFTLNKPSIAWGIYETTHRDGWPSDTFAPTPTQELRAVARDYSYSLSADSHQLGLPPKIYLLATIRYIRNNPFEYLSQLITRVKRMWTYVETYPERWHATKVWVQLIFHRVLILLALVGIPLSLTVWYQNWIPVSIFLYVTVAFIPTIGLPRYAVPAMPFVIILATFTFFFLLQTLCKRKTQLMSPRLLIHFIVICLLSITIYYLDVPILLKLAPNASTTSLHNITIAATNLLIIAVAFFLYQFFTMSSMGKRRSIYVIAFPLLMVMLIYNNVSLTSKTWHEWYCPLSTLHQKIRHTILLPDDFNANNYRKATLLIDLFPGGGQGYSFHINLDGEPIKRYEAGIKTRENKFDNKFFGLYKSFFFDTYKLSPEDLRQWYEIELPLDYFDNRSQLTIECFLNGTVNRKNNYVMVFGDYTTLDSNAFEGPCIPLSDVDTSMTKIMPYSGDYRFEKITPLSSKRTISEYHNGLEWQKDDLSSVRGIQSGSYRIRVELIRKDGRQVVL